jgi:spore photoproduct lyase
MQLPPYQTIYVTEETLADAITQEILRDYPQVPRVVIPVGIDPTTMIDAQSDPKRLLLLTHSKGQVVKDCPGTAESYLCCRYQVINQTQNCPLNCSYCILQYYFNQPATVIYTDYDRIFTELKTKLAELQPRFVRIGTGELGDSLALPGSRSFAHRAIPFFAEHSGVLFELKTKTEQLDDLLQITSRGHTLFSWSLNPPEVVQQEEYLTASVKKRLVAARKAMDAGFLLGFHLDPILFVPDWERQYQQLLEKLYAYVEPSRIVWISLGSLRFPPSMKTEMIRRYPHSKLPYSELIKGLDGKLRYPRPLRVPMYRQIFQQLKAVTNPPFVYFCMESPLVWLEVTGRSPENNAQLDFMFAESIHQRFPELLPKTPQQTDYE